MRLDLFECPVSARTSWLFVAALGADGEVGFGECSDAGNVDEVAATFDVVGQQFASAARSGLTAEALLRAVDDALLDSSGLLWRTMLGGVEQALCDLSARRDGEPLWKWLGGSQHEHIPLYANVNRAVGGRTPHGLAEVANAAVQAGFTAIKCAPFDNAPIGRELGRAGVECVSAARQRIGADIELMVDFHLRLDRAEAAVTIAQLDGLDLAWLEDVVDCRDLAGLRWLRGISDRRLAGGEFAADPTEVMPAVSAGLLDVVMPDVKHAGGLLRARQLAAAVPAAEISPHNPCGPIATAASAHLFAAIPNAVVLEYAFGEVAWRGELVGEAEQIKDGRLSLADGPGLGLVLDVNHPRLRHLRSIVLEEKQ